MIFLGKNLNYDQTSVVQFQKNPNNSLLVFFAPPQILQFFCIDTLFFRNVKHVENTIKVINFMLMHMSSAGFIGASKS